MFIITIEVYSVSNYIFINKTEAFEYIIYESLFEPDIETQEDFLNWVDNYVEVDYLPLYMNR